MHKLASYIMRSQRHAAMVSGVAAAIPMLFWLGAASASLALLRHGVAAVLTVLCCALLPAIGWAWLQDDPFVLLTMLGTFVLAGVLRQSLSWSRVLWVSVAVGLLAAQILLSLTGEAMQTMVEAIEASLPLVLGELYSQMDAQEVQRLQALLLPLLGGLLGSLVQLLSLACLALARYWQASLYNPGGFGQEFRAIRLPAWQAGGLVLCMLFAPQVSASLALLVPICAAPLACVGLSVMHGLMKRHDIGLPAVVALYALLLVFAQLIYPVLVIVALTDSVFDFRGLRASARSAGPGEG